MSARHSAELLLASLPFEIPSLHFGWYTVSYVAIEMLFIIRAIVRPHRTPASRIAWVVVIGVVPVAGMIAYLLFGETSIGRRRLQRVLQVQAKLQPMEVAEAEKAQVLRGIPEPLRSPFQTAESINGFPAVGGNRGRLFSDSNEAIDRIVADIDDAADCVHLLFYIWLDDNNGTKVVEALKRAAARGVNCRAMVDNLGSRGLIQSEHWSAMKEAGVKLAMALPIGNPFLRSLRGRIDLRNHRKIVVIDDRVTYCGSQNCADAEFRIKPKYAPWVDAVVRFEGPIVRQNQHLFASDWMTNTAEDLTPLLNRPLPAGEGGFAALAFGTGPTVRNAAMPEMFVSLMHAAQREIVITTPYYVPDESMQNALRAAAHRGIDTTIVFPARNDSRIVAAASESYYPELLEAGVKIYEYVGGLLHAKTFTVDGCATLIGSANLDRRSFDLNYENNILFYDRELTDEVRQLQDHYVSRANPVTWEMVEAWSLGQRLWRNTVAMLGPLL